MLTILTQPSSTDLTTLDRVKAELGITVATTDAIISDIISDISDEIVRFTQRVFAKAVYSETLPGFGSINLMLENTPILAVAQVLQDGGVITDSRIENAEAGLLQRDLGWTWTVGFIAGRSYGRAYGGSGRGRGVTQILTPHPVANSELPKFQVDYTAGYSLPGDDLVGVTTISVDSSDNSFNDSASGFPVLAVGDIIKTSGFGDAANNGSFTVVSATSAKIVVSATTLVTAGAGATVSILVRTLPRDVERAAIELAKSTFLSRERDPNIKSKKVGDLSITYGNGAGIDGGFGFPPRIAAALTRWRRII